jgi:hypothetical protein
LLQYKRFTVYLVWEEDFPLTASLKIKRNVLADHIRQRLQPAAVLPL